MTLLYFHNHQHRHDELNALCVNLRKYVKFNLYNFATRILVFLIRIFPSIERNDILTGLPKLRFHLHPIQCKTETPDIHMHIQEWR